MCGQLDEKWVEGWLDVKMAEFVYVFMGTSGRLN